MKTLTKESQVKRILTQRQNKKPCRRHPNERACLKAEQWQHSVGLGFKRQWNVRCCPGISVHLPPQPHIPCVERGMASSTKGERLLLLLWKPDLEQGVQHPQQDMLLLPSRASLGGQTCSSQTCSGKFASNGSRLKENFIWDLKWGQCLRGLMPLTTNSGRWTLLNGYGDFRWWISQC